MSAPSYKILKNNIFTNANYSLVPIRFEDRMAIMKWRNEQIYHLRQNKPLTEVDQNNYFTTVVAKLFEQEKPNQLLFSFLENEVCIGYGGLVHINWLDKNAEISFIMNTDLEAKRFHEIWSAYLVLLEQLAFEELKLHKIYTYAFDLRPHLYEVLNGSGFIEEARLKEHCYFNAKFLDVVYHAKFNSFLSLRFATLDDLLLYYNWINDIQVRANSYQSEPINLEDHTKWFTSKINNPLFSFFVFENHLGIPVGQVRIQIVNALESVIGISNATNFRGRGYASRMLVMATDEFFKNNPKQTISAYIKLDNKVSEKVFQKAGFVLDKIVEYESLPSYHYIKKYENR